MSVLTTMPHMLTASEVGARLSVQAQTVQKWAQLGLGPRFIVTPRGHRRWAETDVDAWIAAHTVDAGQADAQ